MDSEKDEQPKKSLKTLHLYAKPAGEPPEREQVIEPISPHILDMMRPQSPPKPISMRLSYIRETTDDDLMKWLTTESEHPGRPLDEGTKMAITAELMRRQAARFERPAWWRDRNYLVGLVAAVGGVVAAAPIVWGWLTK